jgi:hypothetical protein
MPNGLFPTPVDAYYQTQRDYYDVEKRREDAALHTGLINALAGMSQDQGPPSPAMMAPPAPPLASTAGLPLSQAPSPAMAPPPAAPGAQGAAGYTSIPGLSWPQPAPPVGASADLPYMRHIQEMQAQSNEIGQMQRRMDRTRLMGDIYTRYLQPDEGVRLYSEASRMQSEIDAQKVKLVGMGMETPRRVAEILGAVSNQDTLDWANERLRNEGLPHRPIGTTYNDATIAQIRQAKMEALDYKEQFEAQLKLLEAARKQRETEDYEKYLDLVRKREEATSAGKQAGKPVDPALQEKREEDIAKGERAYWTDPLKGISTAELITAIGPLPRSDKPGSTVMLTENIPEARSGQKVLSLLPGMLADRSTQNILSKGMKIPEARREAIEWMRGQLEYVPDPHPYLPLVGGASVRFKPATEEAPAERPTGPSPAPGSAPRPGSEITAPTATPSAQATPTTAPATQAPAAPPGAGDLRIQPTAPAPTATPAARPETTLKPPEKRGGIFILSPDKVVARVQYQQLPSGASWRYEDEPPETVHIKP